MNNGFDQYYDEATEPGKRERAYAWTTAIGLQDVDGLKPSRHLYATARRHIEGEITQEEARRIVDEYYETKDGHELPPDTQEADKVAVLLYGYEIELKNRHLRIGFEYGSPMGESVSKLHRRGKKLDFDGKKLDIESGKLDIASLSAPTQANIKKLREAFVAVEFFKRADALKILELTPTAVSNLLSRMNKLGLIVSVSGHGKGAWRFNNLVEHD